MATSGTTDFNPNRNQLIKTALRKIGAIAAGETPSQQLITDAAFSLNSMVKAWMATGIHIWTETEAILFVQVGQARYTLGPASTDHSAQVYSYTTVAANASMGDTSISVASNTDIVVDVALGITLASGYIQWATVTSVVGTTIGLDDPLDDAVMQGAYVYSASPNITRPLRIPAARRWNSTSNIDTPLLNISRLDYFALPNKSILGTVNSFFYDPRGGANDTGQLYLWPTPSSVTNNNIKFTWYRPIQDFDTVQNTADLPQEWINTLVWNLAAEMAPEYGLPMDVYGMIKAKADESLELAKGWDREPEAYYFGVDFTPLGR